MIFLFLLEHIFLCRHQEVRSRADVLPSGRAFSTARSALRWREALLSQVGPCSGIAEAGRLQAVGRFWQLQAPGENPAAL